MRLLTPLLSILLAVAAPVVIAGCDTETPTTAVVDDGYPAFVEGGDTTKELTVFKVWYTTTLFVDPVAPGTSSDTQRIVPGKDYAYALLAVGWDLTSTSPPARLIALRSKEKLPVGRGDTLHIAVSDETFIGNCAAGKPLAQDDADLITQSIFPGDFATVQYDAKTCTATPLAADGDAGTGDAATDAPITE